MLGATQEGVEIVRTFLYYEAKQAQEHFGGFFLHMLVKMLPIATTESQPKWNEAKRKNYCSHDCNIQRGFLGVDLSLCLYFLVLLSPDCHFIFRYGLPVYFP